MIGAVFLGIIGIIFIIMGWLIWKKEKISFFHGYHYDKVSDEDKRAFCTVSGWGIMIIGIGIFATAVIIGITDAAWSFIIFAGGFAAGLALLIYAGSKYNSV